MCNARRLGPCECSEQGPRRRALHIAQVTLGGARHKAARSGFTWATANARRRGPCERSEQGPRRRALAVAQVKPGTKRRGLALLDLPRTSADEGLASGASEARGGGRS
ncbi:hypothetical protein TYRP_002034, partial [Tyrophagus putrescentiae]